MSMSVLSDFESVLYERVLTPVEHLKYLKNYWERMLILRVIDLKADEKLAAEDSKKMVELHPRAPLVTILERIEDRKERVKQAKNSIEIIDNLAADDCREYFESLCPLKLERCKSNVSETNEDGEKVID